MTNTSFTSPQVHKIISAINAEGGEIRFVGGCVRDYLCGLEVNDVDLATNLQPLIVVCILQNAGIKVIPTGIAHGTVTAVVDDEKFEITTLRVDKETDGRHAKVEFTDSWYLDAARRDFTINAMSLDAKGNLYDYFGGVEDLAAGRVRFIGRPEDRINEDYLRILRYFRFYAKYGRAPLVPVDLNAIKKLAHNIPSLSVERIWVEMSKMLVLPNVLNALMKMNDAGVLYHTFPEAPGSLFTLKQLMVVEQHYNDVSSLRRLAALMPKNFKNAGFLADRMKFSCEDKEKFTFLFSDRVYDCFEYGGVASALCYKFGKDKVKSWAMLRAAKLESRFTESYKLVDDIDNYVHIDFPFGGEHAISLGVKPGPKMGSLIAEVEDWWLQNYRRPSLGECLNYAKDEVINDNNQ